jgi:hypothetical protein
VKGWRWLSSNLHALERRTHCSLLAGGRSLAGCVCTVQESLYHRVHSRQQQGGRAARGGRWHCGGTLLECGKPFQVSSVPPLYMSLQKLSSMKRIYHASTVWEP